MSFPETFNPGAMGVEGLGFSTALRFYLVSSGGLTLGFDLGFPAAAGDLLVIDFGSLATAVGTMNNAPIRLFVNGQPRPFDIHRVAEPSSNVVLWRIFTRAQTGDQILTLSVGVATTVEGIAGAWRIPGVQEGAQDNETLHEGSGNPFKLAAFTDRGPGLAIAYAFGSGFNLAPTQPNDWRMMDYCSSGSIVGAALAMDLTGAGAIAQGDFVGGSGFGWTSIVTALYEPGHVIIGSGRGFVSGVGIGQSSAGPTEAGRVRQPGADAIVPLPPSTEPDPPTTAHRSGQYPT